MPKPNPLNPLCPYCNNPMSSNGTQASGARVYRCRRGCKNDNGKTVTFTDSDRPACRLGEKSATAKTQAEHDRLYRERHPEKYREIHKRKRERRKEKG